MGRIIQIIEKIRYGFKSRLISYILLLLIIFIFGFEIYTFISIREYNYNNLKASMHAQGKFNSELYLSYVSDFSINDNIDNDRLQFINNSLGQIQIIDKSKTVIYDSLASPNIGLVINASDVENAINGVPDYDVYFNGIEKVMSYSFPIINNGVNAGVIRVTSGLSSVDRDILGKFGFFVLFGGISLAFGGIVSYLIAGLIFSPINSLTVLASKLSNGQYNEKSKMSYRGEIGELAKTMDEMSANIIHKEEIKTEFISSVSHELRTPLTSIKGWSITLQDDTVDRETINEGLKIIEKESDRLSDMVEDLLDFSRFKSPRFSLNKTQFNIIEIVKNIIKQLKPRTSEKEIDVIFNFDDSDIMLIADSDRIKQVMINLLDNAIKFTGNKGTIAVNIISKDLKAEVVVEVIDTGIGISEDEISLVTTKFYKGSSSGSHTGLGLSICEEIVIRHGGNLEIESKINEGTTVRFRIPRGDVE